MNSIDFNTFPKSVKQKVNIFVGEFSPFHLGDAFLFDCHTPQGTEIVLCHVDNTKQRPFDWQTKLALIRDVVKEGTNISVLGDDDIANIIGFYRSEENQEVDKIFCYYDRAKRYENSLKYLECHFSKAQQTSAEVITLKEQHSSQYIRWLIQNDLFEQFKAVMHTNTWHHWEDLRKQIKDVDK